MANLPHNAVAVGDAEGLDLLGRLATYTFPDEPRPAADVLRAWHKHGLDVNDLPDVRSITHLFQSACRSVETKRRQNGNSVEVDVREVLHDNNECVYQITRVVRDKRNRVIEHSKGMTLALNKSTGDIDVRELDDFDAVRTLEEQVREHFAKHAKDLPGQKIRNAVRDTLLKIGAQNLRRKAGGLYFVPDTYRSLDDAGKVVEHDSEPILNGLQGFLKEMYEDRGSWADFHTWPLVASDATEKMVAKHFAINAREKARELLERAVQRAHAGLGERGIRQDFMTGLYNEQRKLLGAVAQFEQMVALEKDEIVKDLQDLDEAIRALDDMRAQGK